MYFIGKTLYDKKAGVLAAFFIVFDISIMSRSLGGDPDTDAISILMALLTMAIFLKTYKYLNEKKKLDKKGLFYTVLTGVTLGIFSHTWVGYWYVVWLITGLILLKFIIDSAMLKSIKTAWHNIKHIFYSYLVIMAILILLFTIPFYGISRVIDIFAGPIEFQSIKTEEGREFPNVYVSVAEMQESGGIKDIIDRTSAIGGIAVLLSPFFLMVYAILYLVYSFYKTHKHIDTVILLFIWFIGPLLATIIAVRFSILFAAPMAIGSSILLSKIMRMIIGEDKKIGD
jgi:asparagine N-glycosylation enzyme membrane subunit Stt3